MAIHESSNSLTQERWTPDRGVVQAGDYAFDSVGNLLRTPHELPGYSDAGAPTRFTRAYNALNQWVGYYDGQDGPSGPIHNTVNDLPGGDPLFVYDGNPTAYKGTACTYDAQNHLTAYGTALTAGYRGDGLRAWKESGGVRTYYLYVGTTLLCELGAGGTVTAYHTWGPTGLLARADVAAGRETWYAFDPQGDVAHRLAADGRVLSTDRYDAWGNAQPGSDTADSYGYKAQAGYLRDAETGLYLCTWRYYDPQAGRWLTEDPIGYAGGVNVYGYCGGQPVGRADPLGRDAMGAFTGGIVGLVVGGVLGALTDPGPGESRAGGWSWNGFWKGAAVGLVGGATFGGLGGWSWMAEASSAATAMAVGSSVGWGMVCGGAAGLLQGGVAELYDIFVRKEKHSMWCVIYRMTASTLVGAAFGGALGVSAVAASAASEITSMIEAILDAVATFSFTSITNLFMQAANDRIPPDAGPPQLARP